MGSFCRLGVLGDPLTFTRSPDLHRAGLAAIGWSGESAALRTGVDALGMRLASLAAQGWRGVNLTHPLKSAAIEHLDRVAPAAARARSVNTVGFGPEGWWGESTDGPGFVDLLAALDRDPAVQRSVVLGAGGAARSVGLALLEQGAPSLTVSARRPENADEEWRDVPGATIAGWRSAEEKAALGSATLVINATPLSGRDWPAPLDGLGRGTLVVDLVYGEAPTPWVEQARARGLDACDGLGLLVFQARRSLALWTGTEIPLAPLLRAVGWPR